MNKVSFLGTLLGKAEINPPFPQEQGNQKGYCAIVTSLNQPLHLLYCDLKIIPTMKTFHKQTHKGQTGSKKGDIASHPARLKISDSMAVILPSNVTLR